jgi:predicted Zn-dependent peptidase
MGVAPQHWMVDLRGGAKLLSAELPDRASVSLVVMLAVGSRFEDDRIGGASHFVEHLFFKGTRKRPTAKDIAEAVEGVGGVMNASTDKELTVYWTRVPQDQLELAIDVVFDVVTDSKLAPRDVERERSVILEELKMYLDQPQDYVHSLFEQIMWPGHPLGRDIIGTVESISRMSRDDLVAYIQGHYRLPNMVVGLAGAFDQDWAGTLIDPRLTLPDGRASSGEYVPAPPPLDRPGVLLHRKDTEQAHVCLGTRALSYLDPDRRGLAYDVHAYSSKHRDGGYFAVYLGVDPRKTEEALDAVLVELRKVVEQPVPDAELTKVREFTKGRLRLGLESTNSLASWLCQQQLLTGEVKTVEEVVSLYEAVTVEDLQRVARRVLAQPLQVAIIGPFESDAPFRTAVGA